MSRWHGLVPCLQRELLRGRFLTLGVAALSLLAVAITPTLHGSTALIPGLMAFLGGVGLWFGPLAHLGMDRVLGYLEFDRTLPIPLVSLATGRLLGASVRILPLFPAMLALLLGFREVFDGGAVDGTPVVVIVAIVLHLLATIFLWWLLALNARWSFRRLWWIAPTLGFLPQIGLMLLPTTLEARLSSFARGTVTWLGSLLSTPKGAVPLVLMIVAVLVISGVGAVRLFASGLRRYEFDPTQLPGVRLSRSRVELTSIRRGPLLAVTRLRLRLATEQFRSELLVLVCLFLVAGFGPEGIREFAHNYIPVLAALLPAGIAFQLFAGRLTGDLEGIQQLPHSRVVTGAGFLTAIAVMALPGAVALELLHAINGTPLTLTALIGGWGWFVTLAWLAASIGLWLRPRVGMALALGAFLAIGTMLFAGAEAPVFDLLLKGVGYYRGVRARVGAILPLYITAFAIVVGLPLFANGLARYSPKRN